MTALNPADRRARIESFGVGYLKLVEAMRRFPQECWDFKPTPGSWSMRQVIAHLADSEAHGYVRCRFLVVQPGAAVLQGFDQDAWAGRLGYDTMDVQATLKLFKWLRVSSYELIRTLPESAWANACHHTEHGMMTLDDWLDSYDSHVRRHIKQMQRNFEAWKQKNTGGGETLVELEG